MKRRIVVLAALCGLTVAGLAQAAPRAVVGELFSTDN